MRTRSAANVRRGYLESETSPRGSGGGSSVAAKLVRSRRKRMIVAALMAAALLAVGFVVAGRRPVVQALGDEAAIHALPARKKSIEEGHVQSSGAGLRGSETDEEVEQPQQQLSSQHSDDEQGRKYAPDAQEQEHGEKTLLVSEMQNSIDERNEVRAEAPWQEVQNEECNRAFGNGFSPIFDECGSRLVCWENSLLGAATMCRLRDLKIDNRRIVVAPGNEPIDTVRWRKESEEMCIYKTGAFTLGQCDSNPLSLAPRSKFPHYLHDVMRHMGTSSEALTCTETVTTPTLLVTRYEYANIYHTMTDWYNVYQTIQINGLQEVNIVFLDGHSAGALDEAWPKLFRTTPKYVSTLTPGTCFKEAYLVAPGYGSTLSHATMQRWVKCPPSLYLKDFTRHFLASLGLHHMLGDARSARRRPRVLFLLRKSYLAHPRIRQTPRTLANAKDLVEALRKGLPDVDVEPTSFENMPFAEQVATVRDADVLLSVHGAGLTHLLFMRPGTLVVELIPSGYESNHHYDSFSAFVGVRHIRVSIPRDTPNHGITVDAQQLVNVLRREELHPV